MLSKGAIMLELILLPCLGMVYHHINQKKRRRRKTSMRLVTMWREEVFNDSVWGFVIQTTYI